jgi:8-oxo-dGTP diphosphatase
MSLNLIYDKYDGVIVGNSSLPKKEEFEEEIRYLINSLENKKLLWIKIDIKDSTLIPILTNLGFIFHHCNENDITLIKKLISNPIIPTPKNHTLGVGAVVTDEDKLLVIKDKIHPSYKLPGGHIDDNENISSALIREVYEETGIKVKFHSIISLGHFTPAQFGESNLYIVCKASPLTKEINIIDSEEIEEAKWMKVDEFLNNEEVHLYNKSIVKNALKTSGFKVNETEGLIKKPDVCYELFC